MEFVNKSDDVATDTAALARQVGYGARFCLVWFALGLVWFGLVWIGLVWFGFCGLG